MTIKNKVLRSIAIVSLSTIYGFIGLIASASTLWKKKTFKRSGNLLVIGTFHNPNWFNSHIIPLTKSGFKQVILVCDEPVFDLDGLVYVCPPAMANRLLTRAVSKLVWAFYVSFKYRPDLYMGYHIFPGSVSALLLGSLFGRPSCYQDTSGPLELDGGGWAAENRLLMALGAPSKLVEQSAFYAVNGFEMTVVRGSSAKEYVLSKGYKGQVAVITGSVDINRERNTINQRDIDLIFVGRLSKLKNVDVVLRVVSQLTREWPELKAVIVGDGPEREYLEDLSDQLEISDNVTFLGQIEAVLDWVSRSKIFVLTSAWEGVSISMIEAMTMGTIPIVNNVGDLGDLVENGTNGYLINDNKTEDIVGAAARLLRDPASWDEMSLHSREKVFSYCGVDAVSKKWEREFEQIL